MFELVIACLRKINPGCGSVMAQWEGKQIALVGAEDPLALTALLV
jgi:hypothetical protein